MGKHRIKQSFTPEMLKEALYGSLKKFDPRYMVKNPIMFVVEIGFAITLLLAFAPDFFGGNNKDLRWYNVVVAVILFITVLFANFAESVAEGRGKAQAAGLKKMQKSTEAHVVNEDGTISVVPSSELMKGDPLACAMRLFVSTCAQCVCGGCLSASGEGQHCYGRRACGRHQICRAGIYRRLLHEMPPFGGALQHVSCK